MTHDLDQLKTLIGMMTDAGLTELEIKTGDAHVRLSRAVTYAAPAPAPLAAPAAAAPAGGPGIPMPGLPAGDVVTSPMVGTAYLAAEPGAAPFIKVGDNVTKDQTLLIIEAMKVMNPISAPAAGVVKEVLVHDAQPVEFGEPLLVIE